MAETINWANIYTGGGKTGNRNNAKSVSEVLNKELIVTGVDYEQLPDGSTILILKTENEGEIRSGSAVLKKKAAIMQDVIKGGKKVKVKIVQKKGDGFKKYYDFE